MSTFWRRGLVLTVSAVVATTACASSASASVALDSTSTRSFSNVNSVTWSHSVAGADRLVVVGISYYGVGRTVSSVTYGSASLTRLSSAKQGVVTAEMWYLVGPATGANTVAVTITGGSGWGAAGATSWTGVDPAAPVGTPATAGGVGTTASVTAASATGEFVHDVLAWNRDTPSPGTATVGAGQTSRWNNPGVTGSAGSNAPGAANVTMRWTLSAAVDWAAVAAALRPRSTGPDLTPPSISGVSATAGMTSANVTWTTDEPADSQVEYGTSSAYGSSTTLDSALVTGHAATLASLGPGTLYHYRVKSRDATGNLAVSADSTFTTSAPDTVPPVISSVSANAGLDSAIVTWTTDEASDSRAEYGPTPSYGSSSALDPAMVTVHTRTLSNLSSGTLYHYRALSRDAAGNLGASGDFTFTTSTPDTTPPVISGVSAAPMATAATVTWTTDENSDSQAEYGVTSAYGSSAPLDPTPVTAHSRTLSNLNPATLYHYRVSSRDGAGNLAVSGDFTTTTSPASSSPNIIVFLTDNQDAATMAFMPRVNRLLAGRGVTFVNARVSYPLCAPSRASLLSGRYAANHGVRDNYLPNGGYGRFDNANTIATWLRGAGYHTGHIGHYLIGYFTTDTNPSDGIPSCREIPAGWNEWYGINRGDKSYDFILNENGTLRGYGSFPNLGTSCPVQARARTYQTDLFAQKAVDFVNRRAAATDGKPFFLQVAFGALQGETAAGPDPAPRHNGMFANQSLPTPPSFNEADVSDKPMSVRSKPLLNATTISQITTEYRRRLEALQAVDEAVESVVNALTAGGLLGNTVIVFTSDQGQLMGEHRLWALGWPYEESVRVPFVVSGPGFTGGVQLNHLVSNIDLAPTFVQLAGATPTLTLDGRSFANLPADPNAPWRTSLLLEATFADRQYRAVRTPSFLFAEYDGEAELYDVVLDPFELVSRHADPAYAARRNQLKQRLDQLKVCSGSSCWP